jgi:hypothetical protein
MLAIGNGELDSNPPIGKSIRCPHCNKSHSVKYGKDKDGVESKLLAFYSCGEKTYLAGINGRLLR